MTMLDRMRRHKNWLKWSLFLVVIAFIIFYIPSFLRDPGGAPTNNATIASVEGRDISAAEYRRVYTAQLAAYRASYGGSINEQLLRQLGVEQQILQQMVDEHASLAEAERLKMTVSDAEVRERILTMPAFQENGRFIGETRYRQLLASQRPRLVPAEFENNIRKSLLVDKLRSALTEWVMVSDQDIEQEFKQRNEKVKLEVVTFTADKERDSVTVADADVAAFFEPRKETYRIGEKRKIKFLLIDTDALRAQSTPSQQEVERNYNENLERYSTPLQVRASHILLKTQDKDEAAVKAKAEEILKQAKAGADFAELARKNSEDESNAKNGGDLDYFGKGRMVPEFDAVAFEMKPGTISDLVKTQFGYHIIKLVDRKDGLTRPVAEVQAQITDQLASQKAQTRATETAEAAAAEIKAPADLDRVGKARNLRVQESGLFTRDEPIMGLGMSPEASSAAFELKDGAVSGPVRVQTGYAFLTVTGKQDPYVPKLDEVKDKVREDLIKQRAGELSKQKAAAALAALKQPGAFEKAAKDLKLDVKTTDLVTRGGAVPDVGVSAAIDAAAFALPAGGVSDPIQTDAGTAVVHVIERKDATPAEFAAGKETLRSEMLNERRNRFFSAYMVKAKQRMVITVNREVLRDVLGASS